MASEPLPGPYPISCYVGDTRVWSLAFTEDDGTTPIDLSGKTWTAQIRANDGASATIMAEIDVDDTDAVDGLLVLTLTALEAANLVKKTGSDKKPAWDLQGDDGTVVRTYLLGAIKVLGDVSRVTS
jgi:hypothetical protein